MNKPLILFLTAATLILFLSCNRKTSEKNSDENSVISGNNYDDGNINYEDPFKNQSNEFCTVIRKLEVSYYDPDKDVEDITTYPKKYCLLDVCIDKIDNEDMIINLGDTIQTAYAVFSLIKVFDNYEEAKAYEIRYGIKDVLYED
jgi:hypothetical protein